LHPVPQAPAQNPGSIAASAAFTASAEQFRAQGALPLCEAAEAKEIDPATAGVWAKRSARKSLFRGPRGSWWVRSMREFDAEVEKFRCLGEECNRYALLSAGRLCSRCRRRVPRGDRLTAEEFAAKRDLPLRPLTRRLETSDLPGERIDRDGFPDAWLVDEGQILDALRERFTCKGEGCTRFALGDTGYCGDCSPAGNAPARALARWPESPGKVRKVCTCGSVREVYPSLQRSGDLCVHCSMAEEDRETTTALLEAGLAPMKLSASLLYLSPTGVRSVVTLERRKLGRRRRVRLGVNAREVLRLSLDKNARRKLSQPLSALNGTDFGRPPVPADKNDQILRLGAEGHSLREIAAEVGVSKSHVANVLAANAA
jgi:hypothetical protein